MPGTGATLGTAVNKIDKVFLKDLEIQWEGTENNEANTQTDKIITDYKKCYERYKQGYKIPNILQRSL